MKPISLALLALCLCLTGCEKKTEPKTNIGKPEPKTNVGKRDTVLWEFDTGSAEVFSPAIGPDGAVYVGSYDHKLYALSGKTGDKLWEFETGLFYVDRSPAIGSDGTIYVGSTEPFKGGGKLYAINGQSGVKKWEFTGGTWAGTPTLSDNGTIYMGTDNQKLYAIKTDSKGPAKSPWPMFGQNAQHTGRAPAK